MMLSQNAMQVTFPLKEPVEAQKTETGEGRDFSVSLAYAFGEPVNISSLEQQQSKALDTPLGFKLAGNKSRGYTKARTIQPVRRFIKQNTTYKSLPDHCSITRGGSWINNNSHTPYLGKAIHLAPFAQGTYAAILHLSNHSVPLQKSESKEPEFEPTEVPARRLRDGAP